MWHKGPEHYLLFLQAAKEQLGASSLERPFDDILPGAEDTTSIAGYLEVRHCNALLCLCMFWSVSVPGSRQLSVEVQVNRWHRYIVCSNFAGHACND